MAGLRVIWVGKTRQPFALEGVALYQKRLGAFHPLECVTVRSAAHSARAPEAALAAESEAILKKVAPGDALILLDEGGREPNTAEFAEIMRGGLEKGGGSLTFLLGGAYGVDGRIKARADDTLRLSRLTLPHQLARVVLLEQLYRAATLLAGHAYHHE